MDTNLLEYFIAAYETGKLNTAARICNISSQGMSMAISRLESQLDQPLFIRRAKGISATPAAGVLYPYAVKIIQLSRECRDKFANMQAGSVKISCAYGVQVEFASDIFNSFRNKYPNIQLKAENVPDNVCETNIAEHESELALTPAPINNKAFQAELVYSTSYIRHGIVVRKDHPLAEKKAFRSKISKAVPLSSWMIR